MRLTVLSLPNATSFPPLATTAVDVPGDGQCLCHHKWETISQCG